MMKQIANRTISLLLAFILVLSMVPNVVLRAAAVEVVVSGTLSNVPGDTLGELDDEE